MTPTRLLEIADNSELLGAKADARDLRAMAKKMSDKASDDLVERLRGLWPHAWEGDPSKRTIIEAADTITSLRAQLAAAEARLTTTQEGLTLANETIIAAEAQLASATKALEWLRWGIEEVGRYSEPKAGAGITYLCNVVTEALTGAGIPMGAAAIQKPIRSLKPDGGGK